MVDSDTQSLYVLQDDKVKQKFTHVALGRGGVSDNRVQGDDTTPKGTFRIAWINTESRYHLFFGLDYPNKRYAEWAYQSRLIDVDTYFDIRKAVFKNKVPPQNTALGGYIGIHGTGDTNPRIHRLLNWTKGCIALTNKQIEQLAHWVNVGTKVVIR